MTRTGPARPPPSDRSGPVDLPGVAPRAAAVRLLHEILTLGRGLDEVFERQVRGLPLPDRALAHALAAQALRWCVDLDRLIDSACARPPAPDARVRQVLRVALAGRLRLETPMHATLATALAQLEAGPRRLCHAVLARLDRDGAGLPPLPTLPEPWASRWAARHDPAEMATLRAALGAVPPTDLSLRNPEETAAWTARLDGWSLEAGHVRIAGSQRAEALAGMPEGAFWVQDLAARQVVHRLGEVAGRPVLDLCAAPGGKTLQLAAAGAEVTAVDRLPARMARLEANLARTGLAARTIIADIMQWAPDRTFGQILLDAPCSATGTFRRHPEVLHRRHPRDLGPLADIQRQMLARACGWLAPGGRLVYAVCSLEPEEGEAVVAAVQAEGIEVVAMERLMPGSGQGDGFFIATLRRAGG